VRNALRFVTRLAALAGPPCIGLVASVMALGAGVSPAKAGITYTCDPNVNAPTCNALNTTIANIYNSTFSNANANIYIQYGTTGLGQSTTGGFNTLSYSAFVSDLAAEHGGGVVRADALASLAGSEPSLYGGGDISITGALGAAFGLTGLQGVTASGGVCTLGPAGCYDGLITITNDPGTPLYYRNGPESADEYDYYSVVEHETDEVLGTSSCVDTTGPSLANGCLGVAAASATDLFRYNAAGQRVFIDPTPGAYFSFDGGLTNGTSNGKIYNTLSNGDDYADFVSTCPANLNIQDATGCPGTGNLDITNDHGGEINILDAIGFNLRNVAAIPEPSSWALMMLGLGALGAAMRARRQQLAAA
jgi:hypothetical protein